MFGKRNILIALVALMVGVSMSFFAVQRKPDINTGVKQFQNEPGAVLLDVRTKEEYVQGHIPNSRNFPLQQIQDITDLFPDKNTALVVYCRSGARSGRAAAWLKEAGYKNVTDIGGIMNYSGALEMGEAS